MLQRGLITVLLLSGLLYPMGPPPPNYDNEYDELIEDDVMAGAVMGEPDPIIDSISHSIPNPVPEPKKEFNEELEDIVEEVADISSLRLKTLALQERVIKDSSGKRVGKRIPVKMVRKNSKVVYVNSLVNSSELEGENIVVKNPIPNGTQYMRGSAKCGGDCTISYSIDKGKSFLSSDNGAINYIEFHFNTLSPKREVRMGFRVIVK